MSDQYPTTDIVIVGAGVGGCIAALALVPHFSVTLVDRQQTPAPRVGECLPPATQRIFRLLDLMALMDGGKHITSHGMTSYWGSEQPQSFDNLCNPDGLGWHVDRQQLETDLRQAARERGVSCLWPMTLTNSASEPEHYLLSLTSADQGAITLKARVVIDATGRHSTFARQRGARRQSFDKLVSCWMTFGSSSAAQTGFICPRKEGWWYSAPLPSLPDGTSTTAAGLPRVLSFQTDADLLGQMQIESVDSMLQAAAQLPVLQTLLDEPANITRHGMVAATSSRLSVCADQRWFAIGDAAMSLDPLSSQGMFNAMASAMQLSDLLIEKGIDSVDIAPQYTQQSERIWQQYLHHKKFFYQQERRWQQADFWYRRVH
ncbi:MAG: FAD-dependent monooxygenase [Gammaproteobacteria bacterium]|nr:FAD-dependent monooxygenase [Gammaproteobacteria bacterium]